MRWTILMNFRMVWWGFRGAYSTNLGLYRSLVIRSTNSTWISMWCVSKKYVNTHIYKLRPWPNSDVVAWHHWVDRSRFGSDPGFECCVAWHQTRGSGSVPVLENESVGSSWLKGVVGYMYIYDDESLKTRIMVRLPVRQWWSIVGRSTPTTSGTTSWRTTWLHNIDNYSTHKHIYINIILSFLGRVGWQIMVITNYRSMMSLVPSGRWRSRWPQTSYLEINMWHYIT